MTATIICILFAVIFAGYGFWMSGNGSGTGFFLIWFALAALLAGCAAVTYLDGWTRLPVWILWIIRGILLVFVVSFVVIEGCIISQMHAKADENLDYIIVLGAQVRSDGPSKVLKHRLNTAIDYLEKNPETICIVSGGQGYNEPCTEALQLSFLSFYKIDLIRYFHSARYSLSILFGRYNGFEPAAIAFADFNPCPFVICIARNIWKSFVIIPTLAPSFIYFLLYFIFCSVVFD